MRMNVFRLLENGNWECLGMFCTELQVNGFAAMYGNIELIPCSVTQFAEDGEELMSKFIKEEL